MMAHEGCDEGRGQKDQQQVEERRNGSACKGSATCVRTTSAAQATPLSRTASGLGASHNYVRSAGS